MPASRIMYWHGRAHAFHSGRQAAIEDYVTRKRAER